MIIFLHNTDQKILSLLHVTLLQTVYTVPRSYCGRTTAHFFVAYRLYGHATEHQAKLAEARRARDAETNLTAQASRHSMTWVSQELTKGRNNGEYSNYGERLYVEGMLDHEKKKAAVRACLA